MKKHILYTHKVNIAPWYEESPLTFHYINFEKVNNPSTFIKILIAETSFLINEAQGNSMKIVPLIEFNSKKSFAIIQVVLLQNTKENSNGDMLCDNFLNDISMKFTQILNSLFDLTINFINSDDKEKTGFTANKELESPNTLYSPCHIAITILESLRSKNAFKNGLSFEHNKNLIQIEPFTDKIIEEKTNNNSEDINVMIHQITDNSTSLVYHIKDINTPIKTGSYYPLSFNESDMNIFCKALEKKLILALSVFTSNALHIGQQKIKGYSLIKINKIISCDLLI